MSAPDTPQPTKRAAAFMAANAVSPVVSGVQKVKVKNDVHVAFTLEDGSKFNMYPKDLVSMTVPVRWLHG